MRNAFIVTQGPMENTIEDFWEMIWEYKSHAIVMLTPLKENEKVRTTQLDNGILHLKCVRFVYTTLTLVSFSVKSKADIKICSIMP